MSGRSLFQKVWDDHIVVPESADAPAVLYIDLHLTHEVTTPEAFNVLRSRGLSIRRPDLTVATLDHSTPTVPITTLKDLDVVSEPAAAAQIRTMIENCEKNGIRMYGYDSDSRGIVHVIGPSWARRSRARPSSAATATPARTAPSARSASASARQKLATCWQPSACCSAVPKTLAINVEGKLPRGVTAKDVILAIIGKIGVGGGTGSVIEYRGSTIRAPRHGTAHDHLQHVHRGRRARRHDRARRHHHPVSEWPAAGPEGCGLGCRRGPLARPALRCRCALRQGSIDRRQPARADGHLRHQPGHGRAGKRRCRFRFPTMRASARHWPT
jgi:hypothetical protein